jgi:hypothetical protein
MIQELCFSVSLLNFYLKQARFYQCLKCGKGENNALCVVFLGGVAKIVFLLQVYR